MCRIILFYHVPLRSRGNFVLTLKTIESMAKRKSEAAAMLQHYKELKERAVAYFLRIGHPKEDLDQLWRAIHQAKLTLRNEKTGKEQCIAIDRAIEVLGEEEFLSGISRCAFHASAIRYDAGKKHAVSFELYHWWK